MFSPGQKRFGQTADVNGRRCQTGTTKMMALAWPIS
jgi:hypothetical protein